LAALKDIVYKVSLTSTYGDMDVEVSGICFDSRQVKPGFLFIAVKGTVTDGHDYLVKAVEEGAVAILCERLPESIDERTVYVTVKSSAQALGIVAANFYGNPSEKLKLTGVTGTNGKTTTATLLYQLFTRMGYSTGLISTVENRIVQQVIPATHTTPDPINLNRLFNGWLHACFYGSELACHRPGTGRGREIHRRDLYQHHARPPRLS
jgi:UDP-N-acetylmuramoyl-L-alanyl-D-glutamate--2,6-diaminopimelate ligase